MLDINLFRNEENFKKIIESEQKRFKSTKFTENTKKFDKMWIDAKKEKESKRAEKNKLTKEIAEKAKNKEPIDALKVESKKLDEEIKNLDKNEAEYLQKRDENRYKVGNLLLDSVPVGEGEENNKIVNTWGIAKVQKEHLQNFEKDSDGKMKHAILDFAPKSHADLGPERDLFDLERAAKVSGARFYYLKGNLGILHLAILRFAIDIMVKKGFEFMYTPFVVNHDTIEKAAELADFEETLYKVGKDQFLIATAEQTLAAYHMDEVLKIENLPLKYVGFSSAFRKEAGSANKDTRGIFRVHQFDKVEQYVFCHPKDSEKIFEEMVKAQEEIVQALELPYRIVNISSGDMNDTAAKKYDIEIWMPVQGAFRELTSGSITTDYQTRKLNVRFEEKGERQIVHSLNATALASPRMLVALIENHQTKDGKIKIPEALWPYTGFKEI
jgi:seryl-tRNA synthetase